MNRQYYLLISEVLVYAFIIGLGFAFGLYMTSPENTQRLEQLK